MAGVKINFMLFKAVIPLDNMVYLCSKIRTYAYDKSSFTFFLVIDEISVG